MNDNADLTDPRDAIAGSLISLQDRAVEVLMTHLGIKQSEASLHPAVFNVLSAFAAEAKTAVEEIGYFDIDSRSEMAELVGTAFGTIYMHTDRLHFFRSAAKASDRLQDFVRQSQDKPGDYLGYCIVRPRRSAPIGRSLVPPITTLGGGVESELAKEQIRTAVLEHVHVFGVPLVAVGVPFMQQDGALLRCAHVSAWICHYAAVLRGSITRRTTAHFHRAAVDVGRAYPSPGLTAPALGSMLAAADLPAHILDRFALVEDRKFTWADREELEAQCTLLADDVNGLDRVWVAENLSAAVCRYLNSGIPVILSREAIEHTQVVVGYLREKDMGGAPEHEAVADSDHHSDVTAFIVSDDRRGPFEVISLDELVDEILDTEHAPLQVLVPLPRALWMSGEVAESLATGLIPAMVAGRLRDLDSLRPLPETLAAEDTRLSDLNELLERRNALTIRVYAATGVDFKESFARRISKADPSDVELMRRVGTVQLPRFVWVAEALDRAARRDGEDAVVATLVLDATATTSANASGQKPTAQHRPLFFHAPGVGFAPNWLYSSLAAERALRGLPIFDGGATDAWFSSSVDRYATGRWSHTRLAEYAAHGGGQAKLASAGH